jgi:hypothetical protein
MTLRFPAKPVVPKRNRPFKNLPMNSPQIAILEIEHLQQEEKATASVAFVFSEILRIARFAAKRLLAAR